MKTGMRHQEYIKALIEKRTQEPRKINPIHETGEKFSSPPSATPLEENRLLTEYMEQVNLQKIANSKPHEKHPLFLKKFFKMKRNQQVIIYVKKNGEVDEIMGRVSSIGRDFVLLTNLTERLWIPYQMIESANLPTGVPTFTNTHQFFFYDNELKKKLMTNFGEMVSKRDALIQQFYEETLRTNLSKWNGLWVQVLGSEESTYGKIHASDKKALTIKGVFEHKEIPWQEIKHIRTIHFRSRISHYMKEIWERFFVFP